MNQNQLIQPWSGVFCTLKRLTLQIGNPRLGWSLRGRYDDEITNVFVPDPC